VKCPYIFQMLCSKAAGMSVRSGENQPVPKYWN
jgi:hypothetical protein